MVVHGAEVEGVKIRCVQNEPTRKSGGDQNVFKTLKLCCIRAGEVGVCVGGRWIVSHRGCPRWIDGTWTGGQEMRVD